MSIKFLKDEVEAHGKDADHSLSDESQHEHNSQSDISSASIEDPSESVSNQDQDSAEMQKNRPVPVRRRSSNNKSGTEKDDNKNYELRGESQRANPVQHTRDNKVRKQGDKQAPRNQGGAKRDHSEKNSEAYLKIVDYLRKIEWDQQNSQNKMNPFHFMTSQCFWFWVCAEYYSYDFFARGDPQHQVREIMQKLNGVYYQVPQRLTKSMLAEQPQEKLQFETKNIRTHAFVLSQKLKQVVYTPQIDLSYEPQEKTSTVTDSFDDDVFRSSTRALVYNYVKRHYETRIHYQLEEHFKEIQQEIEKQKQQQEQRKQQLAQMSQQSAGLLAAVEKEQKIQEVVQDMSPKTAEQPTQSNLSSAHQSNEKQALMEQHGELECGAAMEIEGNQGIKPEIPKAVESTAQAVEQVVSQHTIALVPERESSRKRSDEDSEEESAEEKKPSRTVDKEDLLLSTILHLPLDKVISILASQIKSPNIPTNFPEPLIHMPSDPFMLINQTHPLESEFLEYLKNKRREQNAESEIAKKKVKTTSIEQHPDVKCQICTDGDYTQDNLIVFCSTCNISLHERCVGLAKVPSENWVCDVCVAFGPKGRWLRCPLCTVKGGALKRTGISSDTILFKQTNPAYHDYLKDCTHAKNKEEYLEAGTTLNDEKMYYDYYDPVEAPEEPPDCHFVWVHYSCSIWVPECYFEQRNSTISIKGIDTIDKKRFRFLCEVCQTSRSGACIKCADDSCNLYYHAECARKAGVYLQQRYVDRMQYFIYCGYHKPLKLTRVIESKNKKYRDEIVKFCRAIEKYIETYKIANVPFKLLKSNKRGLSKCKKESVVKPVKQTKEDKDAQNREFMHRLKDYLFSHRKLTIQLKRYADDTYRVIDIQQPVKRTLRINISKTDQMWELFNYRNMTPIQLFKKYKRILKEDSLLRQEFVKELKSQTKAQKKAEKRKLKEAAEQEFPVAEDYEDPNKLYCLCKQTYHGEQQMMCCDICVAWFHFKCIGFIGTLSDADSVEFNCYRCERYQDPIKIEQRRLKYARYYDPNHIPNIPVEEDFDILKPMPGDEDWTSPSNTANLTNGAQTVAAINVADSGLSVFQGKDLPVPKAIGKKKKKGSRRRSNWSTRPAQSKRKALNSKQASEEVPSTDKLEEQLPGEDHLAQVTEINEEQESKSMEQS